MQSCFPRFFYGFSNFLESIDLWTWRFQSVLNKHNPDQCHWTQAFQPSWICYDRSSFHPFQTCLFYLLPWFPSMSYLHLRLYSQSLVLCSTILPFFRRSSNYPSAIPSMHLATVLVFPTRWPVFRCFLASITSFLQLPATCVTELVSLRFPYQRSPTSLRSVFVLLYRSPKLKRSDTNLLRYCKYTASVSYFIELPQWIIV